MRRLLKILLVPAIVLAVALAAGWAWLWHSEAGAQWAWGYAVQAVAESENEGQLQAEVRGTLGGGLQLQNIRYQDADVVVTGRRADVAGGIALSPFAVNISSARIEGVEVHLQPGPPADGRPGEGLDLRLPFPITAREMQVESVEIFSTGEVISIDRASGNGLWHRDFRLTLDQVQAHGASGELEIEGKLEFPFEFTSSVDIGEYAIPANLLDSIPWLPARLSASGQVEGTIEALATELSISWPDWLPVAGVKARVQDPARALQWTLDIQADRAELPGNWVEQELGSSLGEPLDQFELHRFTLSAEGDTKRYTLEGHSALASTWLDAESLAFDGQGSFDTFEQWSVAGDALIKAPGWPAGTSSLSASATGEQFEATLNAPQLFGGDLRVELAAQLVERNPWQLTINTRNVAPLPLLDVLEPHLDADTLEQARSVVSTLEIGSLDADVRASGRFDPDEIEGQIENLTGRAGERTLQVRGGFTFDDNGFGADQVEITSGGSRILASGKPSLPPGLDLAFDISDLGDLLPDISGSVTGEANAVFGPDGVSNLSGELQGSDIEALGWVFDSLEAQAAGNIENHRLTLTGSLENAQFRAAFAGGLDDSGSWDGLLESLELDPETGAPWRLDGPAGLRFGNRLELESACVTPGGESRLCLSLAENAVGTLEGSVDLLTFSPNVAADLLGWPWEFSQQLDGTVDWTLAPGEAVSAQADVLISAGLIFDPDENEELLETEPGALRFTIERGTLNSGHLDIPFESGLVDVDFAMAEINAGADSPISGRVRLDVRDLLALSGFAPGLTQTTGSLKLDVSLSGTAADPKLEGDVALRNGSFHVVSLGTRLRNIELDGRVNRRDQITLQGSFSAGEGNGEIRTDFDLSDPLRPRIDTHLTGKGLALVDIPDIRLAADTDVEATWRGDSLNLWGHIHVPRAVFAPSYVPSDTASESPDVVIVAGGSGNEEPPAPPLKIFGQLVLSMGDEVVVDLDHAHADLTGSAAFRWSGDAMPMANGQYDMRGEIQAYGQQLEITRASIRYPGVPADNPYLDVRAERRIYGNSLVNRAGVFVNGTLRRPQTEPYTVPPTNADRARALLITGSDFDYEQGVGAVNVGTYIAPKLFLSYGVGLFEEGNVITARYELKENLGVKATSGQDETGLDISYTIER